MIQVGNIKANLNADIEQLINIVVKKTGIKKNTIKEFNIHKKSVDARDKSNVHFVYTFDISLTTNEKDFIKYCKYPNISYKEKLQCEKIKSTKINMLKRPVVIGSGPAGLFSALILSQSGLSPIILERGKDVEQRKKDVNLFWQTGELNINSNVQFGEGGAGTFSDGKLTTGIKSKFCEIILNEFVELGAPKNILYSSKPHIGTDNLTQILKKMRQKIISLGGEFRFQNKLDNLYIENNSLSGIKVLDSNNKSYDIETNNIILSIGHSARDTFEMLYNNGIKMLQKPFSLGARIEHSQELINKSQYGDFAGNKNLGAATYKLSVHLPSGKSVYTFCMCPGGVVVAASSEHGKLAVNGMSEYSRDKPNSNSGLLVSIFPEDFGGNHPLCGMYMQRRIEEKAFEAGGGNYSAPVQLVGDFLEGKTSTSLGKVIPSYMPNFKLTDLSTCLPETIICSMREAILFMDKKLKGFASYDSILTGVETRSSSPVKILRNNELMSNIRGIYPCGEGAGYAGGIMSAASDGIKCAYKLLNL